jgi:hypothetical protein
MHFLHVKLDAAEARVAALRRFYVGELGLPDARDGCTNPMVKVGTAEPHRVEALVSGHVDTEATLPGTPHRITIFSAPSVGPAAD